MARKPDILIGIDVGTTSTRTVAFDLAGRTLAASTHEYKFMTPKPGWTEQDPEEWWHAARKGLREVARGIDPSRVAGVSFSGQMHGSVFLDKDDKVIRPALLWNDGRTAAECVEAVRITGRARFMAAVKNMPVTSYTLPKLLWLRNNEPGRYGRLATLLLPKDYVRLRLTGVKAMDVADGAGTAMMEVGKKRWAAGVLKSLGINPAILPPLLESAEVAGRITAQAAKETGLPVGTPVAAGAGDQPAGAAGCGVFSEGQLMVSLGTSGVLFAPTRAAMLDPSGALATFDHAAPGTSYLMGCILNAGGAFQWFHDALADMEVAEARKTGGKSFDLLTAAARKTPPGAEGLFFLPYLIGERSPHNDPKAKGAFIGLTLRHGRPHMTRAVIEGVCFALRDCLDAIRALGITVKEVRATGGGAKSAFWMQTLADVLGVKVCCVDSEEGPALGAAILAGVATGVYKDLPSGAGKAVRIGKTYVPSARTKKEYDALHRRYRDLYPALKGWFAGSGQG